MVFSSLSFLYAFFPILTVLYFICKNRVYRNFILLIASLFFYAWGEPKFIIIMMCSALCAYLGGLLIAHFEKKNKKRAKLAVTVITTVILIGFLFVFKYLNLFVDTANALFNGNITVPQIILPIGISFYTFQILSYVIDLHKGTVKLQKNFFYLLLYMTFFPQLIAGPIVRYETVELEIHERKENWSDFVSGLERFIFGLSKKVLIANNLAQITDTLYGTSVENIGTLFTWVAVLSYTFQLYFDFSGYSDMAIGIGRMFGFHFLENFNYPYMATSITDFWRRWHISLSTWFRDYIYIPLGGNRVSMPRHALNILITWALTGFWHGAQWSFLLWGLYYAALLLLEKFLLSKILKKLPRVINWLYTFVLVIIGWVIFYNESVSKIFSVIKTMFVYTPSSVADIIASNSDLIMPAMIFPVAVICSFPIFKKFTNGKGTAVTVVREITCLMLLALCIVCLLSSTYNPFIYFRF